MAVSPLAPKGGFPNLPVISGARFASGAVGVRYPDRADVMLAHLIPGTVIAGVFTQSATRSAAVLDCEAKITGASDGAAGIVVNAGNANAFTGSAGQQAVETIAHATARALGTSAERVFTASTGVIGEPLPVERITDALDGLASELSEAGLKGAASAIMTTDTFPKGAGATVEIDGKTVSIAGFSKGSGMIAPDMATMLAFIFTDASMDRKWLQSCIRRLADNTFNAITVDSDTSTSDTVLVAATGTAGVDATNSTAFEAALETVMRDLAHQIVRDGEGASKFVEVRVTGAASSADAKKVARAIADSPLVKTAIAGEDPNWGRIVMAVGKSGAAADRDRLSIRFGDILVAEKGWVATGYREADGAHYMRQTEIVITSDLGLGSSSATVWTCDLTHGYIEINADYRS
ncbi:MAG: bifunctional glutamate N-acetyltransferase/amino-acid acetyltransferase ArgJ [Pseudomonadota bacterium]